MKNYCVVGATGTLGNEIVRQLLESYETGSIICFSRDELKQKEMNERFSSNPKLRFVLGDIRNRSSLPALFRGVHTVFHVAALKHVDSCELNPEESVYTNVIGTMNVADAAMSAGVRYVVFSTTDKAVDPINVYGMCKAISERILLNRNDHSQTKFRVFRWGNVLGSRGSILSAFAKSLKASKTIYLTDDAMTRFWIKIEDAVQFMISKYQTGSDTEAMLPHIMAAPVSVIADCVARVTRGGPYVVSRIGLRPGEKIHEVLRSQHSQGGPVSSKTAQQYSSREIDDMIRPILEKEGLA